MTPFLFSFCDIPPLKSWRLQSLASIPYDIHISISTKTIKSQNIQKRIFMLYWSGICITFVCSRAAQVRVVVTFPRCNVISSPPQPHEITSRVDRSALVSA
jgi:hypothetical protein